MRLLDAMMSVEWKLVPGGGPLTHLRTSLSLGAISPLSRVTSVPSLAPASLFTARSFSQFVLRAITGKCRVQWAVYL